MGELNAPSAARSSPAGDTPARPRVAAVVGASGGIGGALARALVAQGAVVHALSRRAAPLDGATAGSIDIEDEASIRAAAERIGEPVDLVIVATGLLHASDVKPERTMRELATAPLTRLFAVNAIGPTLVAKHFLPLLRAGEPATFAALSARVGSITDNRLGGWLGYRASKAALNMAIATLAIELARSRPNAICVGLHPGTVDTPLSAPYQRGVPEGKLFAADYSATRLLAVLDTLTASDSGGCFDWAGARIAP